MTAEGPDLVTVSPAVLLPERRADEAARLAPPLRVLTDVHLGAGADGQRLRYLAVADASGTTIGVPAAGDGADVRRASAGDGVAVALVAGLAAPPRGLVVDVVGRPIVLSSDRERFFDVDQTNELVVVDEQVVVKWLLHPGHDGDVGVERLTLLARAGFDGVPALRATVRSEAGDLVATVSDLVPEAEDGWTWAVDLVRDHARHGSSDALGAPEALGTLTARMHAALATGGVDVAGAALVDGWRRRAVEDAAAADLPAERLAAVTARLGPIAAAEGTPVIPIHGDLHIGQILRAPGDRYVVIDFDGSPLLSARERAESAPAARDVAGMLASLDHVGRVVIHRTPDLDDQGRARVLAWITAAQAAFLHAYRRTLEAEGRADLLDEALVDAFEVQQECREYAYAARYLPHWRYVPDAALPALLERGPR